MKVVKVIEGPLSKAIGVRRNMEEQMLMGNTPVENLGLGKELLKRFKDYELAKEGGDPDLIKHTEERLRSEAKKEQEKQGDKSIFELYTSIVKSGNLEELKEFAKQVKETKKQLDEAAKAEIKSKGDRDKALDDANKAQINLTTTSTAVFAKQVIETGKTFALKIPLVSSFLDSFTGKEERPELSRKGQHYNMKNKQWIERFLMKEKSKEAKKTGDKDYRRKVRKEKVEMMARHKGERRDFAAGIGPDSFADPMAFSFGEKTAAESDGTRTPLSMAASGIVPQAAPLPPTVNLMLGGLNVGVAVTIADLAALGPEFISKVIPVVKKEMADIFNKYGQQ